MVKAILMIWSVVYHFEIFDLSNRVLKPLKVNYVVLNDLNQSCLVLSVMWFKVFYASMLDAHGCILGGELMTTMP